MRIATMVLMGMAGFVLALMSVALLLEITSDSDSPVGVDKPYCASYKWEMGRIVESCD